MIDEDITYADKGYRSYELKPKSHERVWAVCDSCGIGRWIEFCQYHDLCNACAKKKNRKQLKMKVSGAKVKNLGKIIKNK